MNKLSAFAALAAVGMASSAFAQAVTTVISGAYTYEFRIIADGDSGAPTGAWTPEPLGNTATRIGFWIQARVSQTTGQNWGIGRFTAPPTPATSTVTVTDGASATTLNRGGRNAANTLHGRSAAYANGGRNVGASGNEAGQVGPPFVAPSAPFPGTTSNENGALDQGNTRIYSIDAYVGSNRTGNPIDPEDPGAGFYNPWGVNGATPAAGTGGTPVANGVFSPWANLYRIWVLPTNTNVERTVTVTAFGQLNGTIQAAPTQAGGNNYALQLAPGVNATATYSFTYGIPTPGTAALMGLGAMAAMRRRR